MIIKKAYIASAALFGTSMAANAQSMDYGSLELMFDEPVTEGATGTPKRASEVPINMTIVTSEEIRQSGARDVPEILRRVTGVDVQRLEDLGANISIRGRNHDGQRLRVLINGRDTFRPYEGTTVWASLPVSLEEIRQIEVVRGPATALYGANAVTGVVNIITYSPLYDTHNAGTVRIGEGGLLEASAVSTVKLNSKAGIRLSGGYIEFNRPDSELSTTESLARKQTPSLRRFAADGLFAVSDTINTGFEATYFKGDSIQQAPYGAAEVGESEDYSLKFYASLDSTLGRWTLQAFQNSIEETRNSVIDIGTGPFVFSQSINAKSRYLDISNAQSIGTSNIRLTAGYREDKVEQFGSSPALGTGDIGYKTLFLSGLLDYAVSEKISIAVSARYDSLDSYRTAIELPKILPYSNDDFGTYTEISANAGVTYTPSDMDTVKLMYARGFQAPNLFQIGGQILSTRSDTTSGIGGTPAADSAITTQYEVQYLRELNAISGALSASLYYRKDSDIIARTLWGAAYVMPSGEYYISTDNIADAETYGIELDIKGATNEGIIWALSYAYAKTTDEFYDTGEISPSTIFPYSAEFYEDRSSKHILTGKLSYSSGRFSFDTLLQYKSGYDSYSGITYIPGAYNPYQRVGDVWIGNIAAHYQLTENLRFSIVGQGMLDKLRADAVDPTLAAQRRLWGSLSLSF